jgi:hypothetical protein
MKIIIYSALLFAFSNSAFALHESSHGACAKDAKILCAGVPHGGGAVMKCLKENEAKLSPECKAEGAKMKDAMKEVKNACHDDMSKFCGDMKPGKGRIMKCMKAHKNELSQTCKDEIAQRAAVRGK